MLSQTVAREVRAEIGRQSISRKAFSERAGIPYKKTLELLDASRGWALDDLEAAAVALGVDPLELAFPTIERAA